MIRSVEYRPAVDAPEEAPDGYVPRRRRPRIEIAALCVMLAGYILVTLAAFAVLYRMAPVLTMSIAPLVPLTVAVSLIPIYRFWQSE